MVDGGRDAIKCALVYTTHLATRSLVLAHVALDGGATVARSRALTVTMALIAKRCASVRMVAAVTPSLDPAPARAAGWGLSVTPRAQWEGTAPTAPRRASARMRAGATQRQDTACVSQDGR